MIKKYAFYSLVAFLMLAFQPSYSQHEGGRVHHGKTLKSKKLNALNFIKITGGLGMGTYYGDICEGWDCYTFRHSLSFGAYYRYNQRFCFKADLFWTRLANDDNIYKDYRNLGFRTDVYELSATTMFDIFPFEHKFDKRRFIEPYLHAGIGVAFFNPMGKYNGEWHSLRPLQTEGQSKTYVPVTPVIPFGVGARVRMRHDMNIGLEFAYRITFTDYLDDVSGKYFVNPKDRTQFPDGPQSLSAQISDKSLGVPPDADGSRFFDGKVRGNPGKNDGYFVFNFRFEYMIAAFNDQRRKGNLNRIPTGRKTIKRR